MVKRRINGKVIEYYNNKVLIKISESDYTCFDLHGANVILEFDYRVK